MKKIGNIFLYLSIIISSVFLVNIDNVNAAEAKLTFTNSKYYYTRTMPDSSQHSYYIRNYSFGDRVAFCIQPGIPEGEEYLEGSMINVNTLTNEQKEKIMLIAYYGYDYGDHQTEKFKLATQAMIWEAAGTGYVTVSTERWGAGTVINLDNERNIINDLINHHYDKPSFNNQTYDVQVGETITLTDNNGVLQNFNVSVIGANYVIEGNNLKITPTSNGNITVRCNKKMYTEKSYVVYYGEGQNMIVAGAVDPMIASIKINSYYSQVELYKIDSEQTVAQGDGSLENAEYGIFDLNGKLLTSFKTDKNGYALSDKVLSCGTYNVKEISPSKGYYLDNNRYEINTCGNPKIRVDVKEEVIKNYISILKQYDYVDGDTKFLNAEKNVEFEIYDSKNNLYTKIVTDKNGYATINLPYGVYKFHQVNSTNGYEKIYDFYITVDEKSKKEQYYNILNNALSAYLQVYKIDAETNDVISLSDVTFKILNTDTNQYVSQYVGGKVYSEFKTDETGRMVTYLKLSTGNYKLIEVSNPKGYVIDEDGIPFSIGNDTYFNYTTYGAFVTIKYKNSPIKGIIEINKSGEEVAINEQGINYESIKPLSDVEFELYAAEDILSSDNTHLYYSKNDMIQKIITDENGYGISIDLPLGKYYLKETSTNSDYVLDTENYEIELKELDNKTKLVFNNIDLVNKLKKGTMEFTKTDFVTGQVIPNVLIEIYTENDELIFSGKTNENGQVVINELPVNMKFYIKEIEPANGYILNDEKIFFEIKEEGEIVKCNMTNEQVTIEVPNTDIKDSVDLTFIIVIAELVVGIIIYAKINKK